MAHVVQGGLWWDSQVEKAVASEGGEIEVVTHSCLKTTLSPGFLFNFATPAFFFLQSNLSSRSGIVMSLSSFYSIIYEGNLSIPEVVRMLACH